jgi:glutaredoxin 3
MEIVTIYSTSWCGYCRAAKSLLDRKGVPYAEIDVSDSDDRREMTERAAGRRTVPQFFIGENHVGGFDDLAALERGGQLDALLEPLEISSKAA